VLLQAFALVVNEVPEARLLLIGDGPERESLRRQVIDLNLSHNVLMLGLISRSEMEKLFSTAWVQVIPSIWAEPFGLVAIEAMMRGTAVIASEIGGLAEIVKNEQVGLLVPPENPHALASALMRLLQNRELAEQMGMKGREVAETEYSPDAYVDKFINLYQTIYEEHTLC
jgi:glycosyltransferase involved in cell wall biosynthesis